MAEKGNQILDRATIEKKLKRMALEILEKNFDEKEIILAGIRENGSVVAKTIEKHLSEAGLVKTRLLSISLNKKQPKEVTLDQTGEIHNKVVIVVDDVSNSGRTLLYALKPFLEFHAKKIQTLVLVERRHNSFPVHPDYVGLSIATTLKEHITVEIKGEKITGAWLD
jgi:pyrimidine operon attenuation protein / uracil phosphoribosyltransferase